MTEENASASVVETPKVTDKELNFRNLEAKFEKQLSQERAARLETERALEQLRQQAQQKMNTDDEEDDGEPYIDKKKLKKEQFKFGQQIKQETKAEIQEAVKSALHEERKNTWLRSHPDFYDTLQHHAEKLAQKDPELAETILKMPEGFERQQLVYNNIKALRLDQSEPKPSSVQEKIDANKRSPYYQPSIAGTPPYNAVGDFSDSGQKSAYEKMQELKRRLRI